MGKLDKDKFDEFRTKLGKSSPNVLKKIKSAMTIQKIFRGLKVRKNKNQKKTEKLWNID